MPSQCLFGVMRQHQNKGRHYGDAVRRHIGPPTVSRLAHYTVLEGAGIREALLMGPNARHPAPSTLNVMTGPLPVTFDLFVLFARKRIIAPAQNGGRSGEGNRIQGREMPEMRRHSARSCSWVSTSFATGLGARGR